MSTFVPRLLPDSYIVMVQQDLDGAVIASDSPRSSVKIWLDGLPDPVQYQSAADHLTSESLQEVKQRQRKRNDNTGNPNKRSKLAVICSNKIHEHQESSRVSTRIMAQQQQAFSAKLSPTKLSPTKLSPTKQPAPGPFPRPTRSSTTLKPTGISGDSDPASLPTQDLAIATPKKPARRQNKMNAGSIPDLPDLDCTPIARMNPSSAPPSFPISANPAGSLVSPTKSSDSGPHPESSISNKISKSSGSRSSSPAKQARDLKLSSVRVEWLSATPPQNNSFSTADQAFYQSMKRIGTGDQVIPESVKRKVTAHMRTTESLMLEDHRITHYFASNNQFVEESTRAKRGLSYTEVFNTAAELYQAAIDCRDHEVPEPSWNSHVHTPLFKLALGGYWKEEKMVGFHDITTAAIGDPSLLPVQASNVSLDQCLHREKNADCYLGQAGAKQKSRLRHSSTPLSKCTSTDERAPDRARRLQH